MSAFDGVSFDVMGDGGQFPTMERDSDGCQHYLATIRIASLSARNSLASRVTVITTKPVYGRLDCNCHILAGSGAKTLVVPTTTGTTGSFTAILIALTNVRADGRHAQRFTADAEWIVL